jgi:hypothetical protein
MFAVGWEIPEDSDYGLCRNFKLSAISIFSSLFGEIASRPDPIQKIIKKNHKQVHPKIGSKT